MNEKTNNQSMLDIDFKDLALLLLKRLWLIILCFALFFSYKWFMVEKKRVPTWTATATMYVTNSNDIKYYYSTSDTYNAQKLIQTCGVVIRSNQVRMQIADQLNKNEAAKKEAAAEAGQTYTPIVYTGGTLGAIEVAPVNETEVMSISVTTNNAEKSKDICNAIVKVVPEVLLEKIKVGAAEPIDNADFAIQGNFPSMRSAIVFGLIGAGAMAVLLVIAYLLDTRIRSKEEITQQYGIPVLSEIPNFNVKSKERYTTYYEHR